MLFGRLPRQVLLGAPIGVVSILAVFVVMSGGALDPNAAGKLCVILAAMTVLLGPSMLRIDLRRDLGHLAVIKTWPVRGAALWRSRCWDGSSTARTSTTCRLRTDPLLHLTFQWTAGILYWNA
jgi:hypothetical protein